MTKLKDIIAQVESKRIARHMPAKDAPALSDEEQSDLDAFIEAFDAAWINSRDTAREVETDGFHPSSLGIAHGKCARRNVYLLRGVRKESRFDARTLRVFANGHGVHARLQEVLESMGVGMVSEIAIDTFDPPIKGHADGVLEWRDRGILIEIKSCSPEVFVNRLKWKKPKDEHFEQANIYAHILGYEIVWIIYENKGSQELAFFEKKTDHELAQNQIDDWHVQWLMYGENLLPKRPHKIGSAICNGCDFRDFCNPDPEIGVDIKQYKKDLVLLNGLV